MSQTTISLNESSGPILKFFSYIKNSAQAATNPVTILKSSSEINRRSEDIDDFISKLCEEDPRLDAAISEGSKWVADTFYANKPDSFKKLRLKAGFTQAKLADAINTSQSYIARLENGEVDAGMSAIVKIAHAISIDPKAVFECLFHEYEKKNGII